MFDINTNKREIQTAYLGVMIGRCSLDRQNGGSDCHPAIIGFTNFWCADKNWKKFSVYNGQRL